MSLNSQICAKLCKGQSCHCHQEVLGHSGTWHALPLIGNSPILHLLNKVVHNLFLVLSMSSWKMTKNKINERQSQKNMASPMQGWETIHYLTRVNKQEKIWKRIMTVNRHAINKILTSVRRSKGGIDILHLFKERKACHYFLYRITSNTVKSLARSNL